MANMLDVNTVNNRNLYPSAVGRTIGQMGTSSNRSNGGAPMMGVVGATSETAADSEHANALAIGGQANPVIGAVVAIALILILSFVSKKFGTVDEFKNIRVSPYNVLITTLAVIIGMPIAKYAAVKFPLPGVSTWIASA